MPSKRDGDWDFFILGYFGWGNAGDDAIGLAAVNSIAKVHPEARIAVTVRDRYFITQNRLDWIHPIRFGLISIIKCTASSDTFIITGGTHFHDRDGVILRRLAIFLFFAIVTGFSNAIGNPPHLVGHGIRVDRMWSRFLVKYILSNSRTISVRDMESYMVVQELGFSHIATMSFDLATLLVDCSPMMHSDSEENRKLLAISLYPARSIYHMDSVKDWQVLDSVAEALESILERHPEMHIAIYAFRFGLRDSDVEFARQLKRRLQTWGDRVQVHMYEGDVCQFVRHVGTCWAMIGMRYHSLVFAYLYQKPMIVLDSLGKGEALADMIRLPRGAVIGANQLASPMFGELVERMILRPEEYCARLPVQRAIQLAEESIEAVTRG